MRYKEIVVYTKSDHVYRYCDGTVDNTDKREYVIAHQFGVDHIPRNEVRRIQKKGATLKLGFEPSNMEVE